MILVGLKKDLRYDEETRKTLAKTKESPVTPEEVRVALFPFYMPTYIHD